MDVVFDNDFEIGECSTVQCTKIELLQPAPSIQQIKLTSLYVCYWYCINR